MRLMEAWAEYVYSDRNKHDAYVADEEYSRRCRGLEHFFFTRGLFFDPVTMA